MKKLVVYYSWTGKTKLVATSISKILNADLGKIEEVKERKGLFGFIRGGYSAMRGRCSQIKPFKFDLAMYDLIFLGTPVWALRPAPAINAFISRADLTDKKVVLFVTMGGLGGRKVVKIMKEKIEARGGKVVTSFIVKTGGMRTEDIIKRGEEIAREFFIKDKG